MKIIKRLLDIINILILIIVIVVGSGVIYYRYKGKGIGVSSEQVVINVKKTMITIPIKEIPETVNTDFIAHKGHDTYYELTTNEKAVYNAILTKSKNVLINNDNDLNFNVSLEDFDLGLTGNETYPEIKNKAIEEFNKINFNKVLNSLKIDYPYYFWYLYSSSYSYIEPRIIVNNGDYSESYFEMSLETSYSENGEVDMSEFNKARSAYTKAIEVTDSVKDETAENKLRYFADYILENTSYYDEYKTDTSSKKQWSTFISVFDENPETLSICGGYSDAFQLLCDLSGIECYNVVGYMNSDLHAWNEVYLDGQTYLVDITNSDEGTVGQGNKLYMKPVEGDEYSVRIYDDIMQYKKLSVSDWVSVN